MIQRLQCNDNTNATDALSPRHSSTSSPAKKHARKHGRRRGKKSSFDWPCEPHNAVRGEMALWVAVITQAMMDALSRSRHPEAVYYKHEAINWLTGGSRNFKTVCLMAGLDPDYVRSQAKKSLLSPMPWRAEAGTGKRYEERRAYRKHLKARKRVSSLPQPESA
jgi:hypothetical protein